MFIKYIKASRWSSVVKIDFADSFLCTGLLIHIRYGKIKNKIISEIYQF